MAYSIQWPDYLVLAAFLLISLGIGVYHAFSGGRQRTTSEFIMANRSLGVVPTSMSMLVSYISAILILSSTSEVYQYGIQHLLMSNFAFAFGTLIAAMIFVPWLYPLKLVSVNHYLDMRFGSRSVRVLGAILGITVGVIYMGTAMYAPAIALQAATGLSIAISIPVMSVVSVTYTSLGGMRAVIWTDVFQCGIMVIGMAAILITGTIKVGGVGRVAYFNAQEGRLNWVDWSPDPTVRNTVWGYGIGWTIGWAAGYGVTQAAVQRYSATESTTKARLVLLLNIPGLMLLATLACCTGLVVLAYNAMIKCDPLASGQIANINQILPHFVTTIFAHAPGFTGLFLATLYGGALSSVSSALSGVAANLWEDVLQFTPLRRLSEDRRALFNRLLVVMFGFLATGMAFLVSVLPGTILKVALSLNGAIIGPLIGIFMLGGLTKFANWKGALIGCFIGLAFTMTLTIGSISLAINHPTLPPVSTAGCHPLDNATEWGNLESSYYNDTLADIDMATVEPASAELPVEVSGARRFFAISHNWFQLIGILVTFAFGCIASLIFKNKKAEEEMDEKYIIPLMRSLMGYKRRKMPTLLNKDVNLNDLATSTHATCADPLLHKKSAVVS